MEVGIFFLRPWLGGGTTTFTAHLFKAIEAAGYDPLIIRVKERGEERTRPFAKYEGVRYQNMDVRQAMRYAQMNPTVLGSPANSKYLVKPDLIAQLMKRGMRTVIHDPNEFQIYDHLEKGKKLPTTPICIRPTIQRFYPEAIWIPHPYMRVNFSKTVAWYNPNRKPAVSIARIASVKRPQIILEANRLLPKKLRVKLMGAEYRMYTRNLEKRFPDVFKQSGKTFQFPMTFDAPVRLAEKYRFNVDMTYFPDDGGGTQYAQMEAMDAGTINIMHEDWFRYKGGELKIGKHVLAIREPKELAMLLQSGIAESDARFIRDECDNLLKRHAPERIGNRYMEILLR